jgi:hypothetical protein
LPTDRRDPHAHGEARAAHGCESTCRMARPSVWSARLSVSHRSAADSLCTVVISVAGSGGGFRNEASTTLLYTWRHLRSSPSARGRLECDRFTSDLQYSHPLIRLQP